MHNTPETRIALGTSGWEHESFDACLYGGPGRDGGEKLRQYARFFDLAEVRATFWDETLGAADAAAWADAVAANRRFLFLPKLHAAFTHRREFPLDVAKSMRSVFQELARRGRLGAVVAQFPYAFTNTGQNRYHLEKLAQLFKGFPMAVEFRHASWDQPSTATLLKDLGLGMINTDLPRIRQSMPFLTTVVGETAVMRLHGRNERGWMENGMDSRYDYLYNAKEIRELRRRVENTAAKARNVLVVFNNTTHGKALANALQLLAAVKQGGAVLLPQATVGAFPVLAELNGVVDAEMPLMAGALREAV